MFKLRDCLLAAAGWLADKYRRDQILRWCALADCGRCRASAQKTSRLAPGVLPYSACCKRIAGAIVCTAAALLLPQGPTVTGTTVDHKFFWLCIALALWGLGQGAGPVSEALLADSSLPGNKQPIAKPATSLLWTVQAINITAMDNSKTFLAAQPVACSCLVCCMQSVTEWGRRHFFTGLCCASAFANNGTV